MYPQLCQESASPLSRTHALCTGLPTSAKCAHGPCSDNPSSSNTGESKSTHWSTDCPYSRTAEKASGCEKTSSWPLTGPVFSREHVFGPFEPGSVPPINPIGSFSTGSSLLGSWVVYEDHCYLGLLDLIGYLVGLKGWCFLIRFPISLASRF